MSNDTILTDDYVAGLLVKEATDHSLRYSAMGLEAFNTTSKPTNLPKPNTKFLRHIIRDTDNHNKALLAKEAAESQARLKDLERSEDVRQRRSDPHAKDMRKRQLGDIQSILGGKSRRCVVGDDKPLPDRGHHSRQRSEKKYGDALGSSSRRDGDLVRGKVEDRIGYGRLSRGQGNPRGDEGRRRKTRPRDEHDSDEEGGHHRRHRPARARSKSPARHRRRSRSPAGEKRGRHRQRSPIAQKQGEKEACRERDVQEEDDDSDPLEELIGPAPPPKYRGRGALAGAAGINQRFSESYDPKADVLMDDDAGGGWDDALEAYRDRQKLRQNQEGRMRAAGFGDSQIRKMAAASPREKTEEDVVWSKAGEKREWDRGKVNYDGGHEDGLKGIFSEFD